MFLKDEDIGYDTSYWWVTAINRKAKLGSGSIVDERWSTKEEAVDSFNNHKERMIKDSEIIKSSTDDDLITDKYILDLLFIESINDKMKKIDSGQLK